MGNLKFQFQTFHVTCDCDASEVSVSVMTKPTPIHSLTLHTPPPPRTCMCVCRGPTHSQKGLCVLLGYGYSSVRKISTYRTQTCHILLSWCYGILVVNLCVMHLYEHRASVCMLWNWGEAVNSKDEYGSVCCTTNSRAQDSSSSDWIFRILQILGVQNNDSESGGPEPVIRAPVISLWESWHALTADHFASEQELKSRNPLECTSR